MPETPRPARLRVETEGGPAFGVDTLAPYFLLIYPDPGNEGKTMRISAQTIGEPERLAAMIAAAIRYGERAGVMQLVFTHLTHHPTEAVIRLAETGKGAPIPLDDMPRHLRPPPSSGPTDGG